MNDNKQDPELWEVNENINEKISALALEIRMLREDIVKRLR